MRCGSSLTVTDGITTVTPVTEIDFTSGATVTDGGGGVADVAIGGGGGGSFVTGYYTGTTTNPAFADRPWVYSHGTAVLTLTNVLVPTLVLIQEAAVNVSVCFQNVGATLTAGKELVCQLLMSTSGPTVRWGQMFNTCIVDFQGNVWISAGFGPVVVPAATYSLEAGINPTTGSFDTPVQILYASVSYRYQ